MESYQNRLQSKLNYRGFPSDLTDHQIHDPIRLHIFQIEMKDIPSESKMVLYKISGDPFFLEPAGFEFAIGTPFKENTGTRVKLEVVPFAFDL